MGGEGGLQDWERSMIRDSDLGCPGHNGAKCPTQNEYLIHTGTISSLYCIPCMYLCLSVHAHNT